ncbi:MAG: hypothetical protein K2L74_00955 [Muribaculaceae bacterium]|nr:hypothetical protein [Muribaculaceae bacterium]
MSKTSTPRAVAHHTTRSSKPSGHQQPRPDTLAFVRQFARAYAAPVAGFAGVILN